MKKENCYKFIWGVSILLALAFLVFLTIDYYKYDSTNSAPFYTFVIARALEFLLPSIVLKDQNGVVKHGLVYTMQILLFIYLIRILEN